MAPCSGELLYDENNHVNRISPDRDTDEILENHVIIFCRSLKVTIGLAHSRHASVEVKPGGSVEAGRVGNSGNKTEPHLHLYTMEGRIEDIEKFTRKGNKDPMNLKFLDYPLYRHTVLRIE